MMFCFHSCRKSAKAASSSKNKDTIDGTDKAGKRAARHSAAGRPYPAGGAGRIETATATHKGTVINDRKHFTPQHGGTALCYENKTRSKKLNLDNKCFQQL